MPTVKDMIGKLQQRDPKEVIACPLWVVDDVLSCAKDMKVKLSKKEATEILDLIHRKHDASQGINWDVIQCWIREG